ncbi:hypothetical protein GJ496_000470 [Pomphorhynchus laevis]|nr:hypothetical protein GJ496_000470 [Pomphorhynchus laevis]
MSKRRKGVSKKNAMRLRRVKTLCTSFSKLHEKAYMNPNWCYHFWLELFRCIKLSQSAFDRIHLKLIAISPYMKNAIDELSLDPELCVERVFISFCDLIDDTMKVEDVIKGPIRSQTVNENASKRKRLRKARFGHLLVHLTDLIPTQPILTKRSEQHTVDDHDYCQANDSMNWQNKNAVQSDSHMETFQGNPFCFWPFVLQ